MRNRSRKLNLSFVKDLMVCLVILSVFLPVVANAAIKVGVIGPMKFLPGRCAWMGVQLAADEINAAGGVLVKGVKHNIELVQADDNSFMSTPDAVTTMEKLITLSKVDFVMGGFRSEAVMAQMEVMADYKIMFLTVYCAAAERFKRVAQNYERYKYFFAVMPPNSSVMGRMWVSTTVPALRKIKSELGIKKVRVALLIEKALWADALARDAYKIYPQVDAEVVGEWRPSANANDVTSEMSAIKSAEAHLIFQVSSGPVGNPIAKQWGELQIPAALAGCNSEGFTDGHWKATSGMCDYEVTGEWLGRVRITDKTIPFFDAYRKRFGEKPMMTSIDAYDALFVLKGAIERAGSIKSDAVIVEMEKTDYKGAVGRIVYYPRDHEFAHDVMWGPGYVTGVASQWRDGELKVIWPDGQALPPGIGAPPGWENIKYEGIMEYQLPPWMIKYWKSKK